MPVDLEVCVGREDVEVGPLACELAERLEPRRKEGIVAVQLRDEFARGRT